MKLRRGITMDSGAANDVMPRRMVRRKQQIRSSAGSRAGVHYVAANNARIPNEGEVDLKFQTEDGTNADFVFQVAEVNKALCAVSYAVDHGYKVVFDKDKRTGRDLSVMTHKETGDVLKLRREKNVWVLDVLVPVDDEEQPNLPFGRQV